MKIPPNTEKETLKNAFLKHKILLPLLSVSAGCSQAWINKQKNILLMFFRSVELWIPDMWSLDFLGRSSVNCIYLTFMLYCCGQILCYSQAPIIHYLYDGKYGSLNDWCGLDGPNFDLIFAHFYGMVYYWISSRMETRKSQWMQISSKFHQLLSSFFHSLLNHPSGFV